MWVGYHCYVNRDFVLAVGFCKLGCGVASWKVGPRLGLVFLA